jgi:hydrogenase maturation protease
MGITPACCHPSPGQTATGLPWGARLRVGGPERPWIGRGENVNMNRMPRRGLLLALGHDVLKDDGVGIAAAKLLQEEFQEAVDIVEAPGTGLALLEILEGYDRVLILDAIFTGYAAPGTILEFCREDFQQAAPSIHYAGLPEVLRQAGSLGVEFPQELRLLALEVENPFEFHAGMSPLTRGALPNYVDRARQVLKGWVTEVGPGSLP